MMTSKPPKFLYKYANFDRLDILENQQIRFTQPDAFNDPFEMAPAMTGLATDQEIDAYIEANFDTILRTEYDASDAPYKLAGLSFSQFANIARGHKSELAAAMRSTSPFIKAAMARAPEKIRSLVCVLCLCESPKDLLMWSHYGDEHKGIVIGFDTEHTVFNQKMNNSDEFRHLRRVVYVDERPNINLVDTKAEAMLLTKGKVWEYEHEWRIIAAREHAHRTIETGPHHIHLFDMPAQAIVSVRVGARASKINRTRIKQLVNDCMHLKHLKILQYELHKNRYALIEQ